jgi:hypothetical protein
VEVQRKRSSGEGRNEAPFQLRGGSTAGREDAGGCEGIEEPDVGETDSDSDSVVNLAKEVGEGSCIEKAVRTGRQR